MLYNIYNIILKRVEMNLKESKGVTCGKVCREEGEGKEK